MYGYVKNAEAEHITFLLLPGFSMMATAGAIDTLRAANRVSGKDLYSWNTMSLEGDTVSSSNGVRFDATSVLNNTNDGIKTLFVCSGVGVNKLKDKNMFAKLSFFATKGCSIGGICTGSIVLARAGLLDDYRCTIHWENVEGFVEEFPSINLTASLFEIDRNRFTCAGGIAPVDMMLNAIAYDHGNTLAEKVSDMLIYNSARHPGSLQRVSTSQRLRISHPKLLAAIAQMETYMENPVSLDIMASSVGLSTRQLERLFKEKLGKTPSRYYLELRLNRARHLLHQTPMSILQAAVASGFSSASHFSRCYRDFFSCSPRRDRDT